jgi:glycosyltransferase involved in cell wall biosynthesis
VENALWRREKAIICVSKTLKRLMIETAKLDEAALVGFESSPVAVDIEQFNPNVEPDAELLKLKGDRPLAGYVGTLTAWHGVDLFFDVARILKTRGNPTIIMPVGGEPERVERLRERVRAEGLEDHLHFYGSIDHARVPAFLAAMDICLIADTQDWSAPTKFFEFAAMQRPIIASRSPSVEEVFGQTGTSGLFFKRGDAEGMADAIDRLLKNPELGRELGRAARQRVEEKYTWACSVRTIMELFAKLGATNALPLPACGSKHAVPALEEEFESNQTV